MHKSLGLTHPRRRDYGFAFWSWGRPPLALSLLTLLAGVLSPTLAQPGTDEASGTIGGAEVIVDGRGDGMSGTQNSPWNLNGENLVVGDEGLSTLIIRNGGRVVSHSNPIMRYSFSHIAIGDETKGMVRVTGPHSTWENNSLNVGFAGKGTLMIEDGGRVGTVSGHIGFLPGAQGMVSVTGPRSSLESMNNLIVGYGGAGTLKINNGARVVSTTNIRAEDTTLQSINLRTTTFGFATSAEGVARITGAGSAWENTGDLFVGLKGTGTAIIGDGGTLTSGKIVLGSSDTGSGVIAIGAGVNAPAMAPGLLNTPVIEFAEGVGTLVFNHTGTDYEFSADLVSTGKGVHTIINLAGTTILTGDTSRFTGTVKVLGGELTGNINGDSQR